MRKILFVSNLATRVGSFSLSSVEAAQRLGFEFHIAANWNGVAPELIAEDERKYGVKTHHIDLARSPFSWSNRAAYKQLVKIVRDEKIDFIHCNTPVGGLLGRLAGNKCKVKKILYQVHGFHFCKGAPALNWALYYPVEKWLARRTDALVAINKEDYELARKKFKLRGGGAVYYVPGVGVDASGYGPDEAVRKAKRAELGLGENDVALLSTGELSERKNNRVVIEAMAKLKRPNLYYFICGVGDLRESLQRLADDAGIGDKTRFLGYRTDVKELLQAADCFLLPSYREGLSRSLMEAMASGTPCVASKIRGNVDLLEGENGGFLCAPNDADAFAEKLAPLADDAELRATMGRNNLTNVRKFDFETATREMRKVYEAAFGGSDA